MQLPNHVNEKRLLTPSEVESKMRRYEPFVIRLIALCKDRREQEKLIGFWNDPAHFDDFVESSTDAYVSSFR